MFSNYSLGSNYLLWDKKSFGNLGLRKTVTVLLNCPSSGTQKSLGRMVLGQGVPTTQLQAGDGSLDTTAIECISFHIILRLEPKQMGGGRYHPLRYKNTHGNALSCVFNIIRGSHLSHPQRKHAHKKKKVTERHS